MTSAETTSTHTEVPVEDDALSTMRGLIFGFSITRAIAVAAELRIADRLAQGPRTAAGNCRRRIQDTGRLVVVDIVLSDEKNVHDTYRNCLDLATMTQIGGMERTESEFRALLAHAGFDLREVITMRAPQRVLVAGPT